MKLPELKLKPGRDKSVRNRHPWIFSGAIEQEPQAEPGALVSILSAGGDLLGAGYWNPRSDIRVRLLSFGNEEPCAAVASAIESAFLAREGVRADNTGHRLINGEGDNLPGLIVDVYADVAVMQIGTLGMERLKPLVMEVLRRVAPIAGIYERSESASRAQEGISPCSGLLYGQAQERVQISEYGMKFFVDVARGQKTGFFLDQREMRALVRRISTGKSSVLNCFSYTGGFSVAAGLGGAERVVSVDSSAEALSCAAENAVLNGLAQGSQEFVTDDVFDYLRGSRERFDLVIVDPPAFAKKKSHINKAARAYGELNRLAFARVKPNGYLLSCSCSHYLEEELLGQILFQSARDTGRRASIVQRHRMALDHPVSVFHPEGTYLKSFLLSVG